MVKGTGLGLGLGPGNALVVFFSSGLISVVRLRWFGKCATEYSIDDVTATWTEVKLISSFCNQP